MDYSRLGEVDSQHRRAVQSGRHEVTDLVLQTRGVFLPLPRWSEAGELVSPGEWTACNFFVAPLQGSLTKYGRFSNVDKSKS